MFSTMNFKHVTYSADGRIARVVLCRPEKRNALDDVLVQELTQAVSTAGKDPGVKVVVLSAEGSAFCAGADVEYLKKIAAFDLEQNRSDSLRLANLYRLFYELRKPVIGVVNGPALGGGCGLASVCDFVIASREHAVFGYPEVRIGFIPAIVTIFLVKRVGEGRARELVLRGNTVDAEEARRIGLASMVVDENELSATCNALLDDLLHKNSLTSMGLCKEMLAKLHGMNFSDALDFAANLNAAARMTDECRQGIGSFLKKEKNNW